MNRISVRQSWTAGLIGIALVTTGCGGASKGAATAGGATDATTTAATTGASAPAGSAPAPGATTTAAATTAAPTTAAATKVKATGGGDFCKAMAASENAAAQAPAVNTAADIAKAFKAAHDEGQLALSLAPSSIRPDVQVLIKASDAMYAALTKANGDYSKLDPNVAKQFDGPAIANASKNVLAYVKNTCGLDLGTAATPKT